MYNKYLMSIRFGLHQQMIEKSQLLGRIILYGIIIYIFYQIFSSVGASYARYWYFAITQLIVLSSSSIAFQIEDDIQGERIVYFLLRPVNYLLFNLCEAIGISLVRFSILGSFGFVLCFFLIEVAPNLLHWLTGLIFVLMGILLYTIISVLIGLCAFWIKDIRNLVYLNLTATFCFGGLIVPLEFYSEPFRILAFCTPYPWILWWPAQWITGAPINLFSSLIWWGIWAVSLLSLSIFLYRYYLRSFIKKGS